MKKLVPDPPPITAHTNFGCCRGTHVPVFSVNPGISLDDALVHLAMSLAAATESNLQACDMAAPPLQRVTWATQSSLETCEALMEALLKRGS